MLFNSVNFICFLPVVLIVFYLTSKKWKWLVLLVASYVFYMAWNPAFIGLIILSTVVDYFCGIEIEKASTDVKKKLFLTVSLTINLGLLFYFKYFEFFIESSVLLANALGLELVEPKLGIILPVGISFYTFQTLSYSIDIYRGNLMASRHIGKFALFVSFFPQLVAGPIERATNLIPQLNS